MLGKHHVSSLKIAIWDDRAHKGRKNALMAWRLGGFNVGCGCSLYKKKPAGAGGQKFLVTSSFAGTSLGGDTVIQTTRQRCKILPAEC